MTSLTPAGWTRDVVPVPRNTPAPPGSRAATRHCHIKNLIYLGLPGSQRSAGPRGFSVPPLVRGRGQTFRAKTPCEERRSRMVELIRLKEEKRGFGGLPLRRKPVQSAAPTLLRESSQVKSPRDVDSRAHTSPRPGGSYQENKHRVKDSYGFIRMNPRQYTAAVNSGITHFEYLVGRTGQSPYPLHEELTGPSSFLETDVKEMLGMEECYRNTCKGNVDSLSVLSLRSRRGRHEGGQVKDYTGFSVRSYRNPHLAELLPDFIMTETYRGGQQLNQKMYSPQHHLPNRYPKVEDYPSSPSVRLRKSSLHKPTPLPQFEEPTLRITGTARPHPLGGGVITPSSPEKKLPSPALTTGRSEYADIRRAWNSASLVSSPTEKTKREESAAGLLVVARSMPPGCHGLVTARQTPTTQENSPLIAEAQQNDQSEILNQNMEKVNCDSSVVKPQSVASKAEDIPAGVAKGGEEQNPKPPSAPIMISLDNEDGESKIVDIDSEDLLASGGSLAASREDLSDAAQENKENVDDQAQDGQTGEFKALTTKSRSSEAIVASLKENAEQRQKDFEKLLDEHAVLVQEITRASSSDNLTQENTRE